ncbi:MAG: uracil-DNA glycosylase [Planctomycetota bacterium]
MSGERPEFSTRDATVRAHLEGLRTWGLTRIARLRVEKAAGDTTRILAANRAANEVGNEVGAPTVRPPPKQDVGAELAKCAAEVAACTTCRLCETRTRTVFSAGSATARLMFVGEAPGHEEDLRGEPFVGAAGQLLDRMIGALGLTRAEVYIANVLKCRPPQNRDPLPEEVQSCAPFLKRQISLVNPEVIVALGKPAAHFLLGGTQALGRLRGREHSYRDIPVVVTWHPAYLLRAPEHKRETWQDLQFVIQRLGLTPKV